MTIFRLAIPLLIAATLGCAAPAEPKVGATDAVVELDAFSGIPNPRWVLSEADAVELAEQLRELSPAATTELPLGILGFRGFRIHNPGGDAGIPEHVYISHDGVVMVGREPADAKYFRDDGGAQQWLKADARKRGYDGVF
ncbi:hypothetical protein [Longimicrobium sp.]|jgi:hypothetical protein|uniref:hypothetical protein n=1 Tax=Longimicrobium sp. TaxID=2029185 RepID=UPI002EDA9665